MLAGRLDVATNTSTKNLATLIEQVAVEMMEREACRRKYGKVNPVTDNMMCARAEGAGKEIGRALFPRRMLDSQIRSQIFKSII